MGIDLSLKTRFRYAAWHLAGDSINAGWPSLFNFFCGRERLL